MTEYLDSHGADPFQDDDVRKAVGRLAFTYGEPRRIAEEALDSILAERYPDLSEQEIRELHSRLNSRKMRSEIE